MKLVGGKDGRPASLELMLLPLCALSDVEVEGLAMPAGSPAAACT